MKYYIYDNEKLLGEVSTNKSLNTDEIMYALDYDRFDWNGHEGEDHGDYINKDDKEVYANDIFIVCIEDEQTEKEGIKMTKSTSTFEQYEMNYQEHKLHILIEETKDEFGYYLRVDNYGDFTFMFGQPKQYHNSVTGKDIATTKEEFIELVIDNIEGGVQYGYETYMHDMEMWEEAYERSIE